MPEGAAAEAVDVSIAVLEEDDLPSELQGAAADEVVIVGYELGPDGAEFAEPVVVTFRIDPSEVGIDLPEGAVPVGVLLTENAAGELESVEGGELSREDGDLVAQVTVTHFSPAIFVFSNKVAFLLTPAEIDLSVGGSQTVKLMKRDLGTGEDLPRATGAYEGETSRFRTTEPFTATFIEGARDEFGSAAVSCTAPTDGWVADAYSVAVWKDHDDNKFDTIRRNTLLNVFGDLDLFGAADQVGAIELAVRGRCKEAEGTPTPSGSSTDGGGSSVALNGTSAGGQASGDITGTTGGCEDGNSKEAECVPHVDITGVSWNPVEGFPNLFEIGVTLGGPPPPDFSADYVVSVKGTERGSGTPIVQEQIRGLRGELTCKSFRGGEPGEVCETPAPNQFLIRVDISELMPPIEIELFSLQNTTDGRVGDHYVVEDIGE